MSIAIFLVAVMAGATGFAYLYTPTNLLRPYNNYSNYRVRVPIPKDLEEADQRKNPSKLDRERTRWASGLWSHQADLAH